MKRCGRTAKRRFGSKQAALHAAFIGATQRAVTLRTYRCEHCRDWHLTSTPERPATTTPKESTDAS